MKRETVVECLARYSRTNLALMVFDNLVNLPEEIWRISGRGDHFEMVADNINLRMMLDVARDSAFQAILYRRIENLSPVNQAALGAALAKMPISTKGKFIFTTNNFSLVGVNLMPQVCRVKFRVHIEPATDTLSFVDVESEQNKTGRYC